MRMDMKGYSIKAYAKINLSLDVLGKRPDGYHEVRMIMQQIDLWDRVTVGIKEEAPEIALGDGCPKDHADLRQIMKLLAMR